MKQPASGSWWRSAYASLFGQGGQAAARLAHKLNGRPGNVVDMADDDRDAMARRIARRAMDQNLCAPYRIDRAESGDSEHRGDLMGQPVLVCDRDEFRRRGAPDWVLFLAVGAIGFALGVLMEVVL